MDYGHFSTRVSASDNSRERQGCALCRKKNIHGVFEVPLLFESKYERFFDAVLTLWTDPELRKIRLRNRLVERKILQVSFDKSCSYAYSFA